MEAGGRARPDHLTHLEELTDHPGRFHLFHALRIIEAAYPDAPRLGESGLPREDPVRLGQLPELAFPPSTVAEFKPGGEKVPGVLKNRFFGLFGPHGPLPLHFTEYARDRLRNHRDPTMVAFADMLTHRAMSLLYRAWSSAEPAASFDRPDKDLFAKKVAGISGHIGLGMADRDGMPDDSKRHFAGHLSLAARPAEGLMSMISGFFQAPVRLQNFVGSWLELAPDDRWELGGMAGLGRATSIGSRVWSRASKFRLHIGPVGLEEYKRLLPGSPSLNRLDALVRNYLGDTFDWDVNVILKGDEVPQAQLGANTKLGQVSWIGARDPETDATDLFLTPSSVRGTAPATEQEGHIP